MDPFTQGLIGASVPHVLASRKNAVLWVGLFGFVAGILPDLDVLIRSSSDPLLFLEYHRQFTHAIIFIPVGGLFIGSIFHFLFYRKTQLSFRATWLFSTIGYGTHGILDSFTSYGTMLLWPFSEERFAFNIISVIDPLFSIPIFLFLITVVVSKKRKYAFAALVWAISYLSLGLLQRERVMDIGNGIAEARGHSTVRLLVKPSFGNLLVWKVIYQANGRFFVDAVRAGKNISIFNGESVPVLNLARDFPDLNTNSKQAIDVARFYRFSNGFLAVDPIKPDRIIDVRYSMIPNKIDPLWSIGVSEKAKPDVPVQFYSHRHNSIEKLMALWALITNRG